MSDIDWDTFEVRADGHVPVESPGIETPAEEAVLAEAVQDAVPEPSEPQVEAPAADEPVLYAGRYRTVEEMERAVMEQNSLIGRQGTMMEQLQQQISQLAENLETPRPTYNYDDMFLEDPMTAAETALQARDTAAYERVMNEWAQLNPTEARLYQQTKVAQYRAWQAEQIAQQAQTRVADGQMGDALLVAWNDLKAEIPDIENLREAMAQEAEAAKRIVGNPVYTPMLQSGNPEVIKHALRTLANNARYRVSDVQRDLLERQSREAAAASQRAKAEAQVTSATHTASAPTEDESYDQQFLRELQEQDKTYKSGFQVGDY